MVSHYLFEVEFCNPAAGWEKGPVEEGVREAHHLIWQNAPVFKSLANLSGAKFSANPGSVLNAIQHTQNMYFRFHRIVILCWL